VIEVYGVCGACKAQAAICLCDGILSVVGEPKRTCDKPLCRHCTKRKGLITDSLYRCSTIDLCAECVAAGRAYMESEVSA
jgi:hypothetical protein